MVIDFLMKLCMSQFFPCHILIKKTISNVIGFLIKTWWRNTLDMHKRPLQALKRKFMHASGLPPPFIDKNNQFKK